MEGFDNLEKLKTLHLRGNDFRKIEGLDNLYNLEQLFLINNNNIDEIENIDNLKKLKRFKLKTNSIDKIKNLDGLRDTLKSIDIEIEKSSKRETDHDFTQDLSNFKNLETFMLDIKRGYYTPSVNFKKLPISKKLKYIFINGYSVKPNIIFSNKEAGNTRELNKVLWEGESGTFGAIDSRWFEEIRSSKLYP